MPRSLIQATHLTVSAPYIRNNRDPLRSRSSSSCQSQPTHPSKIPLPVWGVDRGKTEASLQYYASNPLPGSKQTLGRSYTRSPLPLTQKKTDPLRPKSASLLRNPYSNVKAKVNSKPPPVVPKLKGKLSPVNVRLVATPDSTITNSSRVESIENEQPIEEESRITGDEYLEKKVCYVPSPHKYNIISCATSVIRLTKCMYLGPI